MKIQLTRRMPCDITETEISVMLLLSKKGQGPMATIRSQEEVEILPRVSEGAWLCGHLDFKYLVSSTE